MGNELWRWADPNGQQRRVRIDELRAALASGLIAPNTPVWRAGWIAWQPAHEVPELTTSALSAANGVVPNIPPPPLAVVAVQHAYEAKGAESFHPPPLAGATNDEEPPPPPPYIPAQTRAPSFAPPPPTPSSSSRGGMAPTLPTRIGLPPPPEIAAMAAAAKANAASGASAAGTAVPTAFGVPSPGAPPVAQQTAPAFGGSSDALPPPTEPVVNETTLDDPLAFDGIDDAPVLPVRSPLKSLMRDIGEIRAGRPAQNKRLLVVAGVLVACAGLTVVALLVSAIGAIGASKAETGSNGVSGANSGSAVAGTGPGPAGSTPSTASTGTTAAQGFVATTPSAKAVTANDRPEPSPKLAANSGLADCVANGEAKALGWRVVISSGIEAAPLGSALGIGFAISARDGIALSLDPTTLAPTTTAKARAAIGELKRVTPLLVGGKLAAAADAEHRGDKLAGRRTVANSPPIDIGVAEGAIAWAPHGKDSWAKVFGLDGDGAVEALRAIPLGGDKGEKAEKGSEKGVVVAFRRNGAIWLGAAKGEGALTPLGPLASVAGLGQVGAPSLAISGGEVLVAWADRASAQDTWQVRTTRFTPGQSPKAATTFALPEGGLGGAAMSPSVAALGGRRFLLAWAEGPVSNHQVRAATVSADGAVGSAVAVSSSGVNAGQPQVAVGPDGRGMAAFVAVKGKSYEVYATPLTCAPR